LIERFVADPARSHLQDKTRTDYAMLFRALRELWGGEKVVKTISREDCRRVVNLFSALPANASKRFHGMALERAAGRARARGLAPMKPVTANGHLNKLSTMLRWAEREEYLSKNPAVGLKVAAPETSRREARRPFTVDELNAIFSAPLYTGCRDDEGGYAVPGPNRPRRARFWLPVLSLFHGVRLNEAAQLLVDDVEEVDGVTVIHVRPGPGKKLKSDAARRYVPLHPEVRRMGFLDYVAEMRARGEARLFPEIKADARGYYSDHFQKFFARFMRKCGIEAERVSFHSFRHAWADACRDANIPLERMRLLGGWASSGTDAVYGHGVRPSVMATEVAKIRFPSLCVDHLYET
jgi:integrase